jgi:UDP-glucose 4-epimerase
VADPAAAARDLGWHARRSELSTIVGDAWHWHLLQTK